MKKIVVISDTHKSEYELTLPKGDILIHCGDFGIDSLADLCYAQRWFEKQPFKHKIFVAGNHETYLEHLPKENIKKILYGVHYLQEDTIEIEGLKFYGSPYTPMFNNWAFMLERRSPELAEKWSKIPENLDFLITHGCPYQILDQSERGENCGCEILQREVFKKNPKYHVFGHIHHSYGHKKVENTIFTNCSVLDDNYDLRNSATIIEN